MSSPDRPCAQGFGTMRRLRQMRFLSESTKTPRKTVTVEIETEIRNRDVARIEN